MQEVTPNNTSRILYKMEGVRGEILTDAIMMGKIAQKYRKMEIALHFYKDNFETDAFGSPLVQSRAAEALAYDPA